jgi:hypothetical protein
VSLNTLMARVDGLPMVLLEREQVWPAPASASGRRKALSARQRARIERRTAAVHEGSVPRWARALAASEAEELRLEIRGELARAGLL